MAKKGPYKRFDNEFIKETMALIKSSNKSVAAIARELGVSSSTLYGWLKRGYGESVDGEIKGLDESVRIKQLKRELEDVKMERDILKKVVAIFSKQPR